MTIISQVDEESFKKTLGSFPTGVGLLTLEGEEFGVTINSLVSVSLTPFLISFCLKKGTYAEGLFITAFHEKKQWGISILSTGQETIAERFSSYRPHQWDGIDWVAQEGGATQPPLIAQAAGHLTGSIVGLFSGGDHSVFLGSVISCGSNFDAIPLVYVRRSYLP